MLADLDDTVRSGGLGKIFENPSQEVTPEVPKTSRFFRSVSVRTHRNADGVQFVYVYFNVCNRLMMMKWFIAYIS